MKVRFPLLLAVLLLFERRLAACEQCHVHTAVAVLRSGKDNFSYMPSQPLRDQWALFKVAGSIDVVSHADRLRQSKCFLATRATSKPLECATCHNPHLPPVNASARNQTCESCHQSAPLEKQLASSPSLKDHKCGSDCVSCHMPKIQERTVPHGTFTEHWIRVPGRDSARLIARSNDSGPIEPFFQRDRTGPDAAVYQGMGEIVYASLANNARVLGDGAAALHIALGSDSTRADAHFLLGVAYQQLGSTDESIRALERAARVDSNRPETLRALARVYERAGRPVSDVEHQYERALSLQPALAWIRAEYADYQQAEGKSDAAIASYRRALAEQPGLSTAWFNLGTALAEEGKLKESSDAFQKAVQLDPSFAQALTSLLEIHTSGDVVTNVKALGSPLTAVPVRDRGPRAVQLGVASGAAPGVQFLNLPSPGVVQILRMDGTLLRELPVKNNSTLVWDLRLDGEKAIVGGIYRARVQGRDASGRTVSPQLLYFGIVRQRVK
ncbi:MAG: tetratricopeptide repeat protein [Gemmatimonadaceae bacterium]